MKEIKQIKRFSIQRKKLVILLIGVLLLLCAGTVTLWKFNAEAKEDTVQIRAGASEEILYGQLSAVRGNEITYLTAEESETQVQAEQGQVPPMTEDGGTQGERPQMPQGMQGAESNQSSTQSQGGTGMQGNAENQSGSESGADLQVGFSVKEQPGVTGENQMAEQAQGFSLEARPDIQISGGFQGGTDMQGNRSGGGGNALTYNGISYILTEQEETAMIPVGTEVITKLGTETTFSRLAAGNFVAIVRDKTSGEISRVYMIG